MFLTWSGGSRNNGALGQPSQFADFTAFSSAGGTSLLASPTTLTAGTTNNTVTLTGSNTTWTPGTPGSPTFTISTTGSGASITAQVVTSATSASLTITAGSVGVITITDPGTGNTADINVVAAGGRAVPYTGSPDIGNVAIGGPAQHPIQIGDTGRWR